MQSGAHSAEGVATGSSSTGAPNGNTVTAARRVSNRTAAPAARTPHAATLG